MTTRITLPRVFQLNAIDRFAQQIVGPDGMPADTVYEFDFKDLDFIDGSGYTVLSNTIEWLRYHNVRVAFYNLINVNRNGIRYLDACGFFSRYINRKIVPGSQPNTTTLPCAPIEFARAFSWIERVLSPWMSLALGKPYASLSSVRTCVKELFNNIGDHAAVSTGFVHAQHYPNKRELKITVSDFGVGIPATITNKFGAMSDAEAIRLASQEGVTAQSRPNNMGAGINFLIDCITANGGTVLIHSFSGGLKCYMAGNEQVRRTSIWRGSYPGTLVDIAIDTRLFVGDDDERGDVEW